MKYTKRLKLKQTAFLSIAAGLLACAALPASADVISYIDKANAERLVKTTIAGGGKAYMKHNPATGKWDVYMNMGDYKGSGNPTAFYFSKKWEADNKAKELKKKGYRVTVDHNRATKLWEVRPWSDSGSSGGTIITNSSSSGSSGGGKKYTRKFWFKTAAESKVKIREIEKRGAHAKVEWDNGMKRWVVTETYGIDYRPGSSNSSGGSVKVRPGSSSNDNDDSKVDTSKLPPGALVLDFSDRKNAEEFASRYRKNGGTAIVAPKKGGGYTVTAFTN